MVIGNYGAGVTPENYEPSISEEYSMIEKVARQIVNGVTSDNILAEFEFGDIENGSTIEEAIIKLAESHPFALGSEEEGGSDITDDVKVFAKNYPELAVRYYKNWTKKQFSKTVSLERLRKVLLSDGNALRISEQVANSLVQGDNYENYVGLRDLIKFGCDNDIYKDVTGATPIDISGGDSRAYKDILIKIKDIVKGMQFVNADYNTANIKRKTFAEDIKIIMPYTIKNKLDVDELAGVFNLDKAEIKNKIIEVDEPTDKVVIIDKWSTFAYKRLYEMTSIFNPKGLYQNYFLTVERLYGISPLFDGCFFTIKTTAGEVGE